MTVTRRICGFTLVEVLLALVVTTIIVAAMTSAMSLMLRTGTNPQMSAASAAATARAAMDQVVDDLRLALTISERSANAVTMTVPDRDADGTPETIRYEWSGVGGAALTRQQNGKAPVSIADNVTDFNVQHVLRTVGPPPPPPEIESEEQLLAASDISLLPATHGIKWSNSAAQYFKPSLPNNAVSWKVTRIKVQIRRNGGSSGTADFAVMAGDESTHLPTGSAIESASVELASIGNNSSAWVEFPCSQLSGLSPSTSLCLVATADTSQVSYYIYYAGLAVGSQGYFMTRTNNGPWQSPNALQAMNYYVYGTVTTQK